MIPIDAVLTWVDGKDPALIKEKAKYITSRREDTLSYIAGAVRYMQFGEIFCAVASILRFAPYVKRIFIVTASQDPHLDDFIKSNFPESKIPVIIVDHKVLFRGYEQYLPVFNSIAIETMLWRIPDLSEEFIYLNDDFFFVAPSRYEDLFRDGKLVVYAPEYPNIAARFLHAIRRKRKDGLRRFTYKDSLLNGSLAAGGRKYYHIQHIPQPLLKSIFSKFYNANPDAVIRNISHRFRDSSQYNVQSLCYVLAKKAGLLVRKSAHGLCIKFQPSPKKADYMQRKLREASRMKNLRYACMNDLVHATGKDRDLFWDWITRILDIRFQ